MTSPIKPTSDKGASGWWTMAGRAVVVSFVLTGLAALVLVMPELTQSLVASQEHPTPTTIKSDFGNDKEELHLMILLARHGDWLHAQIYRQRNYNNDDDDDAANSNDIIGARVCPLLRQALAAQGWLTHNDNDGDVDVDDEMWNTICNDPTTTSLVDLRPFASLHQHKREEPYYAPLASWTHPLQRPTESGFMPPALSAYENNAEWKYFVMADDDAAHGVWEYNAKATVPHHLRRFVKQILVAIGDDDNNSIQLQGHLSQSGGMHRKFHQTLRVDNIFLQDIESSSATAVLDILVLIPPDLFLNIEEAIAVPPSSSSILRCTILNVPPDRVIDQEEPTFASPAHGVLLRIEFPVTSSSTMTTLEWDILLHVRYPMPLEKADFLMIAVMPVVPWSLTVVDNNDKGKVVVAGVPSPWTAPMAPPQYTWVAAGRKEYLVPVMVSTTLVALMGSVVMLSTLAKAARSLQ